MKFAKELQQDLVPEWRIKYLDYKAGKRNVKAVARAFNRTSPAPYSRPAATPSRSRRWSPSQAAHPGETTSLRGSPAPMGAARPLPRANPQAMPAKRRDEHEGLTTSVTDMHYGSFGLTPPRSTTPNALERSQTLELPAPAINAHEGTVASERPSGSALAAPSHSPRGDAPPKFLQRSVSAAPSSAHGLSRSAGEGQPFGSSPGPNHVAAPGADGTFSPRKQLRRMFSAAIPASRSQRQPEIGMQVMAMDLYRQREREFFDFMDSELDKVESFYKLKEAQAGNRLAVLKEQLREMGTRRRQELDEERGKRKQETNGHDREPAGHRRPDARYIQQVKSKIFRPGPNSRAISQMAQTPVLGPRPGRDASRDYIRRPEDRSVPYRTAKRKLKLAMQEFYRGLELLKSYALLNRTAFRKLNKKYDKAVNARPTYRFMTEKVNKSWFVNSNVLEGHIKAVEDLYAEFFERGNHKLAVGKLKSLTRRRGDESGSAFRSGILIGTGAVFGIQGLTFGTQLLFHGDPAIREQAAYLLQIYGGYFLMLFLFALFVVNCYVWTDNKINYPFIFEFDQRHHLDWRQLAEFPSFFLLMLGVFMWLNFSRYGSEAMFLYYPVILVGLTVLIILLPAPIIAPSSRKWFAYAHWRLLLAGFYPVEFRDFFLGDIYCSLTYAVCNVSLFFCLYANHWGDPVQCNSNHSRLLGFFGALPPIWRFLQCLRRYKDTRNIFPHLVNGGKYSMSIMAAVALSIYRISGSEGNLALFVTFAFINGVYTAVWDVFMDFSLLQSQSRHRFLRDITALKKRWIYYVILVLDPILRFAWIFYAIFTHDRQHSTIVSFMVGFAEVFRRGIWTLLRVENEHCANVAVYKASRDVPLPYRLEPLVEAPLEDSSSPTTDTERVSQEPAVAAAATGVQRTGTRAVRDEEAGAEDAAGEPADGTSTVRRRKTVTEMAKGEARTLSKMMAEAHRQDFVKKRKPGEGEEDGDGGPNHNVSETAVQSDDEDEDEEYEEDEDEDETDEQDVNGQELGVEAAGGRARTQQQKGNSSSLGG